MLVHGGMAQNVGPILEMVTEKYLLRSEAEWKGRKAALAILDDILKALRDENVKAIGEATTGRLPTGVAYSWAVVERAEHTVKASSSRILRRRAAPKGDR